MAGSRLKSGRPRKGISPKPGSCTGRKRASIRRPAYGRPISRANPLPRKPSARPATSWLTRTLTTATARMHPMTIPTSMAIPIPRYGLGINVTAMKLVTAPMAIVPSRPMLNTPLCSPISSPMAAITITAPAWLAMNSAPATTSSISGLHPRTLPCGIVARLRPRSASPNTNGGLENQLAAFHGKALRFEHTDKPALADLDDVDFYLSRLESRLDLKVRGLQPAAEMDCALGPIWVPVRRGGGEGLPPPG